MDDVRLFVDSDADGLSDNEEREGIRLGYGTTLNTSVRNPDSDEDGLGDAEEVDKRYSFFGRSYFKIHSSPTDEDSDKDGIDDKPETDDDGVKLDVFNDSVTVGGTTYTGPYRWDYDGETADSVTVDTDPMNEDTDGDGLSDGKEQHKYHTRADKKVSYSITEIHQDRVVDEFYQRWQTSDVLGKHDVSASAQNLRLIGPSDSAHVLSAVRLTDRTDDFDFVMNDDHELVFRALDRDERTDTWFSNVEEENADTEIWDPDSDDDGLTDGQEEHWVTSARRGDLGSIEEDLSPGTDPMEADTDGDGYWDGWIGVYDVDRTDNVVLYVEHLRILGDAPDLGPVWQA